MLIRQATGSTSEVVRSLVERCCNRGDLSVLSTFVRQPLDGRIKRFLTEFQVSVPDAQWTVHELVAGDNTVVVRLSVRGTFSGPLVGLAAPGREATMSGVVFGHFLDGMLAELWLQADLLGFLQQLGVLPPLDLSRAVTVARMATIITAWSAES